MDYIQFRFQEINNIKHFLGNQGLIVELYFFQGADTNYHEMELCDLNDPSKSSDLSIHIYHFVEEKEVADLDYFQPIIDELLKLNHVQISLVLTTYPDNISNRTDLRSNDFKYFSYSDGFEAKYMNDRINHFMVYEISSETLLSEWEEGLIKNEIRI